MIVREPWFTNTVHAGPSFNVGQLGSVPGASLDALRRELSAVSASIEQAIWDIVRNGHDVEYVTRRRQDLERMKGIYEATVEQFRDTFVTNFAKGSVVQPLVNFVQTTVPGVVAAVPVALLEALRQVLQKTGATIWAGALPIIGLAVVALLLLKGAEGTRTGRRYLRA